MNCFDTVRGTAVKINKLNKKEKERKRKAFCPLRSDNICTGKQLTVLTLLRGTAVSSNGFH